MCRRSGGRDVRTRLATVALMILLSVAALACEDGEGAPPASTATATAEPSPAALADPPADCDRHARAHGRRVAGDDAGRRPYAEPYRFAESDHHTHAHRYPDTCGHANSRRHSDSGRDADRMGAEGALHAHRAEPARRAAPPLHGDRCRDGPRLRDHGGAARWCAGATTSAVKPTPRQAAIRQSQRAARGAAPCPRTASGDLLGRGPRRGSRGAAGRLFGDRSEQLGSLRPDGDRRSGLLGIRVGGLLEGTVPAGRYAWWEGRRVPQLTPTVAASPSPGLSSAGVISTRPLRLRRFQRARTRRSAWGTSGRRRLVPPEPAPSSYASISVGNGYACALTETGEAV